MIDIVLKLNDVITSGKHKGKTVQEMIDKNPDNAKKNILNYLRKGLYFDDEVINIVGLKKIVHEATVTNVVVDRKPTEKKKSLPKDRAKLSTILKDLHTIDNTIDNYVIDDDEEIE